MSRYIKKVSKKLGLAPGTLVHIGKKVSSDIKITSFEYDALHYQESVITQLENLSHPKDSQRMTWINVDGLHDVETISQIGAIFGIDALVLEDIVNTNQRPKMEDFEDYIFIVFKMIYPCVEKEEVVSEQVSLILGANYIISFQEEAGRDVFEVVRQRIRDGKGRIRKAKGDYLVYSLMDAVVDHYFLVLEKLGDKIEEVEEILLVDPKTSVPRQIHHLKRDMIYLRKQVWPLRELLFELAHCESVLIEKTSEPFFRDLYDHAVQVIDTVESFRDILSGLQDIYLSFVSTRLNEVMKILTIFSTIFIPLTFLVGVYGMNFKVMPELQWSWAYFALWGFMIALSVGMVVYFKKKKWF